jgi:hypothetical protein
MIILDKYVSIIEIEQLPVVKNFVFELADMNRAYSSDDSFADDSIESPHES